MARTQTSTEGKSLGEVAREARAKTKVAGQSQTTVSPAPGNQGQHTAPQVVTQPPEIERFMDEARGQLLREDFAGLDRMAEEVRSSKARFPGGGWKLSRFYEALKVPLESDGDWQSQLALLQRWTAARPQSITARVALAEAYLGYAWAARGGGYANTVTDEGWRLFAERSQQAGKVLMDAAALSSKCPHWYELMQEVAMALGADKEQHRAIFEKAIAFEPLFFAYYQRYALALLPKWEGEPGDTEAFAEETYRRVGGKQGAYLYFEIVSSLCGSRGDFSPQGYSWQRLQEGFAALEELYGLSPLKLNRLACLAANYGDKQVAAKAFGRIGPNWDSSVWDNRAQFEAQRSWAGLPASPPPPSSYEAIANYTPTASGQVWQMVLLAEKARNEGRWSESTQMARQAVKKAKLLPGTGEQLGRAYVVMSDDEYHQGHVAQALAMLNQAVSSVSEKSGADSIELASTLATAALSAQVMNDYQRAESYLRRAIEIHEQANGASDPEVTNDLTSLGNLYLIRGRNQDAVELYQRAIREREAVRPDDLAITAPLQYLGLAYQNMGRNEEAESAFLRALHLDESHFGLNSPALQARLSQLANLYHAMGRTADEERMKERLRSVLTPATK